MEQKNDLVCTFITHNNKQINRVCLNIVCWDKTRKVCDSCLTEKHQDHQKDCFTLKQIIEIVRNQQLLFQQFLANIASDSLPIELMSKFQKLELDLELALKRFEKSDYQEDAIKLAVRCYNEIIQEEIKYLMYEESEINEQYSHLRKKHFVILEKLYEQVNEDFMINNFIYRGDNLTQGQNWSQALNYYDQALEMTTNPDHQFLIQKKKCKNKINTLDDILLDSEQLEESHKVLAQITKIQTQSPQQYLACQLIQRGLDIIIYKPQFHIMWDILRRLTRHIDNPILCQAILLIKFRQYMDAYELVSTIISEDSTLQLIKVLVQIVCLIRMDNYKKALELLNGCCLQEPENRELKYWKQILLAVFDNEIQSIPEFEEPQLKCSMLICESMTLARSENMGGALEAINKALKIYPKQELTLYVKGMLLIHSGKDSEAFEIFNLITLDKKDDLQKIVKSSILRFQNQTWESSETLIHVEKFLINHLAYDPYQKLIRLEKCLDLCIILGTRLYLDDDKQKLQFAFDTLDLLKTFDPNSAQLAALKAVTLIHLKKLDEAEKEIDSAISFLKYIPYKKDKFYLIFIQGCILAQNKKYKDAQHSFEETIKLCSNFHRAYACKALMLMKQNNFKLAIVELKNNPEVQSLKSQSVQYNFGIAYTYNQQFKEANQAFMKLGSYKNSKLYLIITLIQCSQYKDAISNLKNFTFQTGQYQTIKLFEALSLIGLKLFEDALKIINNIITQFGGDWRMYLCKAFALYCLWQYNEALNAIEVVLQLQGENTLIICNFLNALILIKLDKKDEANQFFDVIKPKLNNDPNRLGYLLIQEQIDQLLIGNILEQQNQIAQINNSSFLLLQIVSVMETMEVSEEDIELKKSKIDWWLLTVDLNIFTKDLWTLFNYDQKKPKE